MSQTHETRSISQDDKEVEEYLQVRDFGQRILEFMEKNTMDGQYQTMVFTYGDKKLKFTVEMKEVSVYSSDYD